MNLFKTPLASVGVICLWALVAVAPPAAAADKQLFAFKFSTNQPLVYAVTIKSRTVADNNIAGKTSLVKNSSELRYKMRLTGWRKNADGTMTVLYKPFEVEQDLDVFGTSHVVTQIRGLKIRSLQNGIVVIDTEKNVGMAQVKSIKTGIYPAMLSGYFDFEPTGRAKKYEGDLPFIDHWTDTLKQDIGFFHIVFPDHPVAVREEWTQNTTMISSGGATLADPLTTTNTFARDLDLMSNGIPVAVFGMTSANHLQNLSGYFEQMGQKSSLNISQFDHNAFGTFHFDPKQGVLLDAKTTDTGAISMEMLVQGNTATSHVDIQVDAQMTLLTEPPAK